MTEYREMAESLRQCRMSEVADAIERLIDMAVNAERDHFVKPSDDEFNHVYTSITPELLEAAVAFLRDTLKNGPISSNEIYRIAKESGIETNALPAAKAKLKITAKRKVGKDVKGGKGWFWGLNK
jgi:hypothetical protein